nr:Uncharacterised protein [Klebsiella pneumoniae]
MLCPGRLRSRYFFCAMSLMAQGAHRGGQSPPPLYPGLRPAKSPLRGPFDLSLQASGRAEAASVQNTALSPHPCGLPRPSGNVSAILRPPAPAVSVAQVGISTTGRTTPGRVRQQPPPGKNTGAVPDILPGGAALAGLGGAKLREDCVGRIRHLCRHPAQPQVRYLTARGYRDRYSAFDK